MTLRACLLILCLVIAGCALLPSRITVYGEHARTVTDTGKASTTEKVGVSATYELPKE